MTISKKQLFFGAKLLISILLIGWLYRKTPIDQVSLLLADLKFGYLPLIMGIFLINTTLSALKWRILLLSDNLDIPLRKLVVSYLIGGFFNVVLPSNIGGDSYRIYDIMKKSKEGVRTATSVFADRFTGFIALVSLSLVSSLFISGKLGKPAFVLLPLAALLALAVILYCLWKQTPLIFLLRCSKMDRFPLVRTISEKFIATFGRYLASPKTVAQVMLISFTFQLLLIFAVFLMARSLHATIPFLYFSAFVPLITLIEALPISIYGIGVRDAAYVFFFGWAGMSAIQTRSLPLLFLLLTLAYALAGGLLYIWRVLMAHRQAGKALSP